MTHSGKSTFLGEFGPGGRTILANTVLSYSKLGQFLVNVEGIDASNDWVINMYDLVPMYTKSQQPSAMTVTFTKKVDHDKKNVRSAAVYKNFVFVNEGS